MNNTNPKKIEVDKDKASELFKYYINKVDELKNIFISLKFNKSKIANLIKKRRSIRTIDKELYWFLIFHRLVSITNIFWEKTWKLFSLEVKEKSKKTEIMKLKIPGTIKIKNTTYRLLKLPSSPDIIYIVNYKNLNYNMKVYEIINTISAIIDQKNLLLLIIENLVEKNLINKILKNLNLEVYSNSIPSFIIKDLLWNAKNVIRASLICRKEISGTDGMGKITFLGNDVARGISELNARQEIDLSRLGTWTEIETEMFFINVDGYLRFKNYKNLIGFIKKNKKDLIQNKI
jgi:hypothetical protein